MMKYFFLPLWIIFKIYRDNNQLVSEDFVAWRSRHKYTGVSDRKAFLSLAMRFPEYRYLLYYRLPFFIGHLMNIFYPRQKLLRISVLCGGGVIIEHGYASTISAKSIGQNFMFHQNCTVGWNHGGSPIIGDNVKIYPGAVIAGPIRIGNNVTIGANCVVLTDVPDNSLCYGNPCVVLSKK